MRTRVHVGVGVVAVLAAASLLGGFGLVDGPAANARAPRDPTLPGPTTRERDDDRIGQNAGCEGCHPDAAEDWRGSLHRQSYTDPMLAAAIGHEHDPEFCRSCHVPEADPRHEPDEARAAIGVGCVGCHLIGDEVLAAPREGGSGLASAAAEPAPHPIRREAEFAGPRACAGCHEFWFPSAGRAGHELIMQRTVGEHRRSAAADQACQDCHMPVITRGGERHRSHGFHVAGDAELLRAAARITGTRTLDADGRVIVAVRLELGAVGHAFPTGDLFRRLHVEVEAELEGDPRDRNRADTCTAERYLARRFALERSGSGSVMRVEVDDDRVGVDRGPRVVEFVLPRECASERLRWSVSYERVLDSPIGSEQVAKVWDRTALDHGVFVPDGN